MPVLQVTQVKKGSGLVGPAGTPRRLVEIKDKSGNTRARFLQDIPYLPHTACSVHSNVPCAHVVAKTQLLAAGF